jgi:hypothetical protein
MANISNETLQLIRRNLEEALIYFSNSPLDEEESNRIAEKYWNEIDWENKYLAHKGVNWVAKFILVKEGLRQ